MSRRFVFVTQDVEAMHGGGAGPLVGRLANQLGAGNEVTIVVVAPGASDVTSRDPRVLGRDIGEPDGTVGWFIERSRAMAEAVGDLIGSSDAVDLVEFNDFEAVALWALVHRRELGLESTRLGIRIHGPVEALTEAMGSAPPPLDALAELERLAFGMADVVLVPSAALGTWAVDRYGVSPERVVVAPPAVVEVDRVAWQPSSAPQFAALGSLTEAKGAHDLVRAMVPVFDAVPEARLRFIGPDGWSATEGRPMSEVILGLVPSRHRERVELVGPLPRQEALESMASVWAVVVASRFESFCLAAHEARRAGLPVVAPDLPAFEAYRRGFGIRLYDGTVDDLTRTLGAIVGDRGIVEALAAEPPPPVGDPVAPYLGAFPDPRHPQSQAGLATAASQKVAALLEPAPSRWAGPARQLLRLLPGPVARLAVRLVPHRLKERFRSVASWPQEEARRQAEQRRRRTRAAAVGGGFPVLEAPDVTVVIPCFEQGAWVTDAVVSVFEQTHGSWEIVLVDDGSVGADTIRTLDELATWSRIRLVRQSNAGLSAARNAGIAAGTGRFVVPLDADDELAPRFLEAMVARLDTEPSAAFAHCWAKLFGDVDGIWATRPVNPYWDLLGNSVVGCVLLRREAWEAVGGYDESMRDGNEDWELWVRLRAAGWGQVRVMEPLFRYRKHGVSMSVDTESAFEEGRLRIVERHPQLYAPGAIRALKRQCYPLLTVVGGDLGDVDGEVEVVVVGPSGVEGAVAESAGKYVVDRRGGSWPMAAALALADLLEDAEERAWAHDPDTGAVVWRRWALLDPGSGLDGGLGPPPPMGDLVAGAFPDPEWVIPEASISDGARLIRQRPEEAGRLPAWVGG